MGRKKKPEEPGDDIPAWIVSFTDMITLLLAFFVLLQAFAYERSEALFFEGQGSFNRAIRNMGIPEWLNGKRKRIRRDFFVNKYPSEPDPDVKRDRTLVNAEVERMQRLFQELQKKMENQSDTLPKTQDVTVLPVKFAVGSSALSSVDKKALDNVVVELRSSPPTDSSSVYVVGMAPDSVSSLRQWVISAQRASAVTEYLRGRLAGSQRKWTLHAWGGGKQFGNLPKNSYVGLVIMGVN